MTVSQPDCAKFTQDCRNRSVTYLPGWTDRKDQSQGNDDLPPLCYPDTLTGKTDLTSPSCTPKASCDTDWRMWLCRSRITNGRVFNKPMILNEATFSRDSLARHIQAKLSDGIVAQINNCLPAPLESLVR